MSIYEREQSLTELPAKKRGYDRLPSGSNYDAQEGFTAEQLQITEVEKNAVIEKIGHSLAENRDAQRNNPLFDDIKEVDKKALTWKLNPTISFARVYEKNPKQPGHDAYMAAEAISGQSGLFGYCAALAPDTKSRAELFDIMSGALAESVVAMSPRQLETALKLVFFHPNTNEEKFHSAHIVEQFHGNLEPFLGFSQVKEHLIVPQREFLAQIITKWQTEAKRISQKIKQGEIITIKDLKWLELFSNITEMDVVVAEIKKELQSDTSTLETKSGPEIEVVTSPETAQNNTAWEGYLRLVKFIFSEDARFSIDNEYLEKLREQAIRTSNGLAAGLSVEEYKFKLESVMTPGSRSREISLGGTGVVLSLRKIDLYEEGAKLRGVFTLLGFPEELEKINKEISNKPGVQNDIYEHTKVNRETGLVLSAYVMYDKKWIVSIIVKLSTNDDRNVPREKVEKMSKELSALIPRN